VLEVSSPRRFTVPAMAEVRDKGVNFKNPHSLFAAPTWLPDLTSQHFTKTPLTISS
jgi:hypothetical protein